MSKKRSGLGSGLNNTISLKTPKDVISGNKNDISFNSGNKNEKEEYKKRKFSILLSAGENKLLKSIAKRHNLSDSSAMHFILADFEKRNPEIL